MEKPTENEPAVLSYVALDKLRKAISNDQSSGVLNSILREIFKNVHCFQENEAIQRSTGLLVSHTVHTMILKGDQCTFLTEQKVFSNLPLELFLMSCFIEPYEVNSFEEKCLLEVIQCQYEMTVENATTSLNDLRAAMSEL